MSAVFKALKGLFFICKIIEKSSQHLFLYITIQLLILTIHLGLTDKCPAEKYNFHKKYYDTGGVCMTINKYLERLKQSYRRYFDVSSNETINGKTMDIYARFNARNVKYMAVKSIKIWGYETNEYCLVKSFNKTLEAADIQEIERYLEGCIDTLVEPHLEHKSSVITCVLVSTKGVESQTVRRVEKLRLSRSFALGFKGWCDVRLIVVDLNNNLTYANKKGKEVVNFYKPDNITKIQVS